MRCARLGLLPFVKSSESPAISSRALATITETKRILVVNDDGIEAPGLKALLGELLKHSDKYEIVVVAPAIEQSAMSHAITVHGSVRAERHVYQGVFLEFFLHSLPLSFEL